MAHEIHATDRFIEVRSGGKRAWHGLGQEIQAGLSATEAFKQAGLDWATELLPMHATRTTPNGIELIPDQDVAMQIRADNGAKLGTVAKDYPRFDNLDGASFLDSIREASGDKLSIETAGSIFDGKRVYGLLTPNEGSTFEVVPGDAVKKYVLVSWGHGGFAAIRGGATGVRVVCNNTIQAAESDMQFRITHKGSLASKLTSARMLLGYATKELEQLENTCKHLAHTAMPGNDCKAFMNEAFDALFPSPKQNDKEATDKWLAKKADTFVSWKSIFQNERNNGMQAIQGTVWAALNTVTEWCDHERGRLAKDSDSRLNSNLFGVSRTDKLKVQQLAISYASKGSV